MRLPRWHPGVLALPAIGLLGALSYTAFYRALQLGPMALVSPIVAGYAERDDRVELVSNPRQIIPISLNLALARAEADWLAENM